MIKENQRILNNLQVIIDLIMVVLALWLAYWIRFQNYEGTHLGFERYLPTLILLIPLHFFLYYISGLYEPRRRQSITYEIGKIFRANIISALILFTLLYLIKEINFSRQVLIYFILSQCLSSVLGQTMKDIEIICVDDGSRSNPDYIRGLF